MRTTISLDDQLLTQAKEHAARRGKTLSAFIEDALIETLARRRQKREPIDLPVWKGKGGLMPGVPSLDSTSEVLAYLDEADGVFDEYRRQQRDATR